MGFGRQICQKKNIGHLACWGKIFLAKLWAPILVQWVPSPCFPLFNHYFYKKLSLYIQIPNITEGLALHAFWNLEKTVLHEICVSGTVWGPLLTRKSPTCTYITQKLRGSGNCVCSFCSFFPCSLTFFHRGRKQKSGGRQQKSSRADKQHCFP